MNAYYLKHGSLTDWKGKLILWKPRIEYHGPKFSGDEWNSDWHGFTIRLNRSRGFLIGATMGENMLTLIDSGIEIDEDTAIRSAIEFAEYRAELDNEDYWSSQFDDQFNESDLLDEEVTQ